jgi:porin
MSNCKRLCQFLLLALSTGTAVTRGYAQTSLGPSEAVSNPNGIPSLPDQEALFPTMFGLGPILREKGIAVLLDNTNEFDGVVSGPRQGTTNAGQYGLETDINWEMLAGIPGFSTHTVIVGRYGIPASRIFGDNINPSQEIYGAGGNVAAHLVYAYGEESFSGGRVDITAGRIPLLNDFLASPLYCNFQNNAFCGNPKSSSNNVSHSSYPDASWAWRARVRPVSDIYVQTGMYFSESDIYSDAGYRSGFRFNAADITGEAFPVEIGFEPVLGAQHMPGHYKIGFIYDNNDHADLLYDQNGVPFAISGLPARQVKGSSTAYALADQMVVRNGPGPSDGIVIFGGYVHNDPKTTAEEDQFELAALDRAFWHARPQDAIGLAFNYQTISGDLTRAEEIEQELGTLATPPPGEIPVADTVTGVQTHSIVLEANYQIHVFRGVTFAPDVQYFIRPNGQGNLPDAALIGFKSHIEFF